MTVGGWLDVWKGFGPNFKSGLVVKVSTCLYGDSQALVKYDRTDLDVQLFYCISKEVTLPPETYMDSMQWFLYKPKVSEGISQDWSQTELP